MNNTIKVEFNPGITLYHATIDIYGHLIKEKGIKIIKRNKYGVDFGPGFYMTSGNREQAIRWAEEKAMNVAPPSPEILSLLEMSIYDFFDIKIKKGFEPVVVTFRVKNPEEWKRLNHKLFEVDDEEWQDFVWSGRKLTQPPNNLDWVFGPVADGGLNQPASESIIACRNMNQLSIHNDKAINLIDVLEVIPCNSWIKKK